MIIDIKTYDMSRTSHPFVIYKSCTRAFDVDLDKKRNTRSIFSIKVKGTENKYTHSVFEARCAFCAKINTYYADKDLLNGVGKNGDYKLAHMFYSENVKMFWKVKELEKEIEKLYSKKKKAEKERNRLADAIHQGNQKGEIETPYKPSDSNPLSG